MNSSPEGLVGRRGGLGVGLGKVSGSPLPGDRGAAAIMEQEGPSSMHSWDSERIRAALAVLALPYVAQAEGMAYNYRESKSSLQKHFYQGSARKTDYSGILNRGS